MLEIYFLTSDLQGYSFALAVWASVTGINSPASKRGLKDVWSPQGSWS